MFVTSPKSLNVHCRSQDQNCVTSTIRLLGQSMCWLHYLDKNYSSKLLRAGSVVVQTGRCKQHRLICCAKVPLIETKVENRETEGSRNGEQAMAATLALRCVVQDGFYACLSPLLKCPVPYTPRLHEEWETEVQGITIYFGQQSSTKGKPIRIRHEPVDVAASSEKESVATATRTQTGEITFDSFLAFSTMSVGFATTSFFSERITSMWQGDDMYAKDDKLQ